MDPRLVGDRATRGLAHRPWPSCSMDESPHNMLWIDGPRPGQRPNQHQWSSWQEAALPPFLQSKRLESTLNIMSPGSSVLCCGTRCPSLFRSVIRRDSAAHPVYPAIGHSIRAHPGCFRLLAMGNSGAVNVDVHVSLQDPTFKSFGPRSGLAESILNIFNFCDH